VLGVRDGDRSDFTVSGDHQHSANADWSQALASIHYWWTPDERFALCGAPQLLQIHIEA
jgi:hypothetical protein